jgi:crossover junction endodeoxyribonuclease RusA
MLPFEFVVDGPPVSQQKRRRQERLPPWRAAVRSAAGGRWPQEVSPIEVSVSVEITHFYEGAPADVDNIIKPILDGIKGFVYADDALVTDVVSRRRPLALLCHFHCL